MICCVAHNGVTVYGTFYRHSLSDTMLCTAVEFLIDLVAC